MMAKKKLFPLLLALMALLAGCSSGPSAAEGAESPVASEAATPVQSEQSSQETLPPQEETPPIAEINTWASMRLINGNRIIAQGADGEFAILDRDGAVKKTLSNCTSIDLVNQNCFAGFCDGTRTLYDLDGTVICTSQAGFSKAVVLQDDPWDVITYEVVESLDFGAKTVTHFMRTDTFEDILQIEGDRSQTMGMLRYDGTQYLLKQWNAGLNKDIYSTLDGTELPDYQEVDPSAGRAAYMDFMSEQGYRKSTIIGDGIGALGERDDKGTDIFDSDHNLCASYDSQIQFSPNTPVGSLALLATWTSGAGHQTGLFDFQTKEFLHVVKGSTVDGSLQPEVIHDIYSQAPSAFLLKNTSDIHTLVCQNGTLIDNVDFPDSFYRSAAGYVLVNSLSENDKHMIADVETGEIMSEFQAHLTK